MDFRLPRWDSYETSNQVLEKWLLLKYTPLRLFIFEHESMFRFRNFLFLSDYKKKLSLMLWTRYIRMGADKSLARPGRKQATATKLGIYSIYSPRSSIHVLARCSNFCKPLKKRNSECCLSNQVSAAAMTFVSDEKWRPFNCFFSPGNR